ncbi:hypothetical protein CLDAP_27880 [Caldilinea aerophila DSM 14535 = NBRC 104270]|uniref:Uncharacterized protein n=1 Tax=Caldilinea aerophila (strain DSM 14535 / JCM 11387 / NBRC 104270 / STL-6-O1) TaxID=926550 RepID=I0I6E0_CALAS|nr:hypothetical protein CLDAP_27880 [Caldilinea aerophila DSM 14535 = NBRC 104270]
MESIHHSFLEQFSLIKTHITCAVGGCDLPLYWIGLYFIRRSQFLFAARNVQLKATPAQAVRLSKNKLEFYHPSPVLAARNMADSPAPDERLSGDRSTPSLHLFDLLLIRYNDDNYTDYCLQRRPDNSVDCCNPASCTWCICESFF